MVSIGFLGRTDGPVALTPTGFHEGPLIIENLKLYATAPGQTGLRIEFPVAQSVCEMSVVLRNMVIGPGFDIGIELVNCWCARLDGVNIWSGYGDNMQVGLALRGQSHDVKIDSASISHAETGIWIDDVCEGTVIRGATIVGCVHGVFAASSTPGRPWLVVSDSHIAASRACVVATNRRQVDIHDNLFYPHPRHDPGLGWIPVALNGCTEVVEHHNMSDPTPTLI